MSEAAVVLETRVTPSTMPAEEAPLFRSAAEAVRFAVTRTGSPGRPYSSRLLDAMFSGRELGGLDGAAQAGFILQCLRTLGPLPLATLIAEVAPRAGPCYCGRPCCSGRRANGAWRQAVDTIAQEAVTALPPNSKRSYALRSSLVVKIYSGGLTFQAIAADLGIDTETVSRQHRAIHRWLKGARATRTADGAEGIETAAWRDAESLLRLWDVVG